MTTGQPKATDWHQEQQQIITRTHGNHPQKSLGSSWNMVGTWLEHSLFEQGWHMVGTLLCWNMVGRGLEQGWSMVGTWLEQALITTRTNFVIKMCSFGTSPLAPLYTEKQCTKTVVWCIDFDFCLAQWNLWKIHGL